MTPAAAGVREDEQGGVCFLHGWANGCWAADEEAAQRLAALQLVHLKAAARRAVAASVGTTTDTVWRWDKASRREGPSGLLSVLLMLVFLALLREPRVADATRIVPRHLGRMRAPDRAPEAKTIRRRLRALADELLANQSTGTGGV